MHGRCCPGRFTVGVLAFQGMNYLASGAVPKRIGNTHPNIVPYQVFPVADGHIIIATGNDSQYVKLCDVVGAPEPGQGPGLHRQQVAARQTRRAGRQALRADREVQGADLLDKLEAVGVPAGPINNLEQVFDDPHIKHRGMKVDVPSEAAKGGAIPGIRTPLVVDGKPMASERPAPRLGEHTAEILKEIGEG